MCVTYYLKCHKPKHNLISSIYHDIMTVQFVRRYYVCKRHLSNFKTLKLSILRYDMEEKASCEMKQITVFIQNFQTISSTGRQGTHI